MKQVDFNKADEKKYFDRLVLDDSHSFIQQTTAWADIVSTIAGDKPVYIYDETDDYSIGASLYLFRCEHGNILVSNVQAGSIGCFFYNGKEENRWAAYDSLIQEIYSYAKKNNCISVTLTSNPYSKDNEIIKNSFSPEAGMHTFISVINIKDYFNDNGEVIFRDYNRRTNLSRNVKKSYGNDFKFNVNNNLEDIKYWYENIHNKRIIELGGKPLPYELFKNIFSNPEFEKNRVFFCTYKDGKMAGGDVCIFSLNGNFDNFMMSTDSDYIEMGINYFLTDNILKWCYSNGIKIYNWQSSNPPEGGIFNFKKQWGSEVLPYEYFTKIIDMDRFKKLLEYDINETINIYSGHFIAPYSTLAKGEFGFFDKSHINREVNIYQQPGISSK